MYVFDRSLYFDAVRSNLFGGRLTQQQVDGQEQLLDVWETHYYHWEMRWLGYALATTIHETASTMWPIEEYGRGKGHAYGIPDPITGETYYGRGFVQLTWKNNYAKMTSILRPLFPSRVIDLVADPSQALDPDLAAAIMFEGMSRGSFRPPHAFARYFSVIADDAYNARDIINGDKTKVPSWSGGMSIGNLIKSYHNGFMDALLISKDDTQPPIQPPPVEVSPVKIDITTPPGVLVTVAINGEVIVPWKAI